MKNIQIRQSINFLLLTFICLLGSNTSFAQQQVLSTTYYHTDAAGSPVVATDENGDVKWREQYRPYGDKMVDDLAAEDNTRGFTGHKFDRETGLTYMGARYYDPIVGRFMAIDPIGYKESNIHSFNRYAYANNNPYGYVDPDGRAAKLIKAAYNVVKKAQKNGWDFKKAGKEEIVNFVDNVTTLADGQFTADDVFAVIDIVTGFGSEVKSVTNKADTLNPGPFAKESIPARGPERNFTKAERDQINNIGNETGCHTCGIKEPGTKSGNYIPDHQPANALNTSGGPQKLYPHCKKCSGRQAGQVTQAKRKLNQ